MIAGLIAMTTVGVGCSSDGDLSDVTRPEDPIVTLPDVTTDPGPAPTDAPAPEPTAAPQPTAPVEPEPTAPIEPATSEPADEGDGTTSEEAIAITILILVLAVIIGLVVWLARRSNDRGRANDSSRRRVASISTQTRWVAEHGVPALLGTTDPATVQSTWTSVNTTLNDIQQEVTTMTVAGGGGSRAVSDLANAVASMRGSLDSGYRMRIEHPGQTDVIAAVDRSLLAQRDQLLRALEAFDIATA